METDERPTSNVEGGTRFAGERSPGQSYQATSLSLSATGIVADEKAVLTIRTALDI